jgi:hypothetical protein
MCPALQKKGFHKQLGNLHQKSCPRIFWDVIYSGDEKSVSGFSNFKDFDGTLNQS